LVKQGNWLVCTPDDDDDSTSDARSVDQREAAYQKYDSDLRDAWRR
jgi:hypothetical protein